MSITLGAFIMNFLAIGPYVYLYQLNGWLFYKQFHFKLIINFSH